jgi:hypothetical protein
MIVGAQQVLVNEAEPARLDGITAKRASDFVSLAMRLVGSVAGQSCGEILIRDQYT